MDNIGWKSLAFILSYFLGFEFLIERDKVTFTFRPLESSQEPSMLALECFMNGWMNAQIKISSNLWFQGYYYLPKEIRQHLLTLKTEQSLFQRYFLTYLLHWLQMCVSIIEEGHCPIISKLCNLEEAMLTHTSCPWALSYTCSCFVFTKTLPQGHSYRPFTSSQVLVMLLRNSL
jgi:hypothetical protein